MVAEIEDTRPSMYGDQKCNLSEKEQKLAMRKFRRFYKRNAKKLIYDNGKSKANRSYDTSQEYIDAMYNNVLENDAENCMGFSVLLMKEVRKLGFPCVMIWVRKGTRDQKNFGHAYIVYNYLGKNYAADLTAATRGCERRRDPWQGTMLWQEPFGEHMAAYSEVGLPCVQYGKHLCNINFFKEFDEVRACFKRFRFDRRKDVGLPFIMEYDLTFWARRRRIYKLNRNWIPRDFRQVSVDMVAEKDRMDIPEEIIAAMGRDRSPNVDFLHNYTFLGKCEVVLKHLYNRAIRIPLFELNCKRVQAHRALMPINFRRRQLLRLLGDGAIEIVGEKKTYSEILSGLKNDINIAMFWKNIKRPIGNVHLEAFAENLKPLLNLEEHGELGKVFVERFIGCLKKVDADRLREKLNPKRGEAEVGFSSSEVKPDQNGREKMQQTLANVRNGQNAGPSRQNANITNNEIRS